MSNNRFPNLLVKQLDLGTYQFVTKYYIIFISTDVDIQAKSKKQKKNFNLAFAFSANTVPSLPRPLKSFSKFSNDRFSFSFTKKEINV